MVMLCDAMRSLRSNGCAPVDDMSAFEDLKHRHPYQPPPDWSDDVPPPLFVTSALVLEALKTFPRASSPGFSKLRSQHLIDAIIGNATLSAQDCLESLTRWINFALSGKMDRLISSWLSGAPLTALLKKHDGGGVRPIAVGEVLRHLVSRICCAAVKSKLLDIFLPYGQVGVGIRGGLEAAVHSLSSFIGAHGDDPTLCCLKLDMSNAFNNCHRAPFLKRLHRDLPELFGWVQWCYHTEAELRFGHHRLTSSTGVQQGDPLGPLLFSLVLSELMDEIGQTNDVSFQVWYLGDGSFVGQRSAVASLLELVKSKGPDYGLEINMSKCEVFWPSGDPSFPEFPLSIERVALTKGGAELLGSPVWGSEQFFQDCFSKRIEKIWQCQQELQSLENPQTELHLLRSCLSLCKINHLLRTVPPDKVPTQLQLFDHNLHRSLEGIVNCSISESSWLQATLPIRLGGLGLREACRSSPAAYLASCNHSRELASRLLAQGLHFAQSCSNTLSSVILQVKK